MGRRKRTDTLDAQIQTIAQSGGKIEPPEEMPLIEGAFPFWERVVRARAADSWTEVDLISAAVLANTYRKIAILEQEIVDEGDVLKNDRGTQVANPKVAMLETVCRRAVAISRAIHVHAEATQGRARDTGERTKAQKALLDSLPEDDLLAKPVKNIQ